jgi:hypothetical protein
MPGFDGAYSASRWSSGNITPSDTLTIEPRYDGLWIGGAGDVVAEDREGRIATFKCVAGSVLPISPMRIRATGTTATNIVGMRP